MAGETVEGVSPLYPHSAGLLVRVILVCSDPKAFKNTSSNSKYLQIKIRVVIILKNCKFVRKCFLIACQKATYLLGLVCLYRFHCPQQYLLKSSLQKLLSLLGRWIPFQSSLLGASKHSWKDEICQMVDWQLIWYYLLHRRARRRNFLQSYLCITTHLGTWKPPFLQSSSY